MQPHAEADAIAPVGVQLGARGLNVREQEPAVAIAIAERLSVKMSTSTGTGIIAIAVRLERIGDERRRR